MIAYSEFIGKVNFHADVYCKQNGELIVIK